MYVHINYIVYIYDTSSCLYSQKGVRGWMSVKFVLWHSVTMTLGVIRFIWPFTGCFGSSKSGGVVPGAVMWSFPTIPESFTSGSLPHGLTADILVISIYSTMTGRVLAPSGPAWRSCQALTDTQQMFLLSYSITPLHHRWLAVPLTGLKDPPNRCPQCARSKCSLLTRTAKSVSNSNDC